jgi:hypothetical protein
MARPCSVCQHGQVSDINKALVAGEPYRYIAQRFDTSVPALQRHRARGLDAKFQPKADHGWPAAPSSIFVMVTRSVPCHLRQSSGALVMPDGPHNLNRSVAQLPDILTKC